MILEQPDQPGNRWRWRRRRQGRAWRQTCWRIYPLAPVLLLVLVISGCAVQPSALLPLPVSGANSSIQVREFPIIEQSTDSPDHASFQQRVQAAVSTQQAGWQFPGQPAAVASTNRALLPFGYHLGGNPTPPFSGYALYHNQRLVQRDITRFWPVSLKEPPSADEQSGADFLFAFETLNGDRLVASLDGIHPWPAQGQAGQKAALTPPASAGDPVALAHTAGSEASIYAGPGKLFSAAEPLGVLAGSATHLQPWRRAALEAAPGGAQTHRALRPGGRTLAGGKDLNQVKHSSEVFNWQVIGGQPFFFYTRDGLTRLNYAGQDLSYTYDEVIHGRSGATAIYNPGSTGRLIWFYALRDGLWYYVEASVDP